MKKEKSGFRLFGRLRSIQTSIYLVMAVMVLVSIGIVTMISLSYTRTSIFENTMTYTRQLTTQVNNDIDSYIDYMENISSMLAENSDVQGFLFGDSDESSEAEKQLQSQFSTVINSRPDIYNLGIVQAGGRALLNQGESERNPYINIKNLEWYENAVKKEVPFSCPPLMSSMW